MLKFKPLPLLFLAVFAIFGASPGVYATVDNSDPAALVAQAQSAADPATALALYCQAAKLGSGPAQFYIGQSLTAEQAGEETLAAGMLWLDMAILNGVPEAKVMRREVGRRASSKDFTKYRTYNNTRAELPCGPPDNKAE